MSAHRFPTWFRQIVDVEVYFAGRRQLKRGRVVTIQNGGSPLQILYVEDNPGDVRLMREALRGIERTSWLTVVNDGQAALDLLHQRQPYTSAPRPDLIFLDLNLPRKDGREVLAEIKLNEDLRRIPVVVLTTSEVRSDVESAYNLHANCYIKKPADLDEYLAVIAACERFWLSIVQLPSR